MYIAFSAVNQVLRKVGASFGEDKCICKPIRTKRMANITQDPPPSSALPPTTELVTARAWLTATAAGLVEEVYDSPRKTQVIQKTILLAYLVWAMLFGSTLTFVVLAVVIDALQSLAVGVVVFLFLIIGIVMFLIPVVPGLAVYLCGGVLIVNRCWEPFSRGGDAGSGPAVRDENGFYMAGLLATMLCYAMKLIAHVLQQKIFGEVMGEAVWVRSTVKVNSDLIKAIKYIVQQPGLTLAKVCVLCGGPDWPTSVLCGILRRSDPTSINTIQLVIGLTPMIILILPTVMAAAFQLRKGEDGPYDSVASVALTSCAMIQALAFVGLIHYVSDVMEKHKDVLDSYKTDTEVEDLERMEEETDEIKANVTKLSEMPGRWRFALLFGTFNIVVSSYFLIFVPNRCFEPFDLATDDIAELCTYSCDPPKKPFLKAGGLLGLIMLAIGVSCTYAFGKWAAKQTMGMAATGSSV